MEPETLEAPVIPPPTGDELLAHPRQTAPVYPDADKLVDLKLTVNEASILYLKLHRATVKPPKLSAERVLDGTVILPVSLFRILDESLESMPSTTPIIVGKRGGVQFKIPRLTLQVRRNEKMYLLATLKNRKRDKWRRVKKEEKIFSPLLVAETDEQEGGREFFYAPSHPEHPDAALLQITVQRALGELPKKLRMPAEEMSALLAALGEADGNVSEAARVLGQPQRKTARRVARIKAHLKRRGLAV